MIENLGNSSISYLRRDVSNFLSLPRGNQTSKRPGPCMRKIIMLGGQWPEGLLRHLERDYYAMEGIRGKETKKRNKVEEKRIQ